MTNQSRDELLSLIWRAYRALQKDNLHEAGLLISHASAGLSREAMKERLRAPMTGGPAA